MKSDHSSLKTLIDSCSTMDAHTHSDQYRGEDRSLMLKDVVEERILTLSSATDPESIRESFRLNRLCPWILTAAGIHPWKAGLFGPQDLEYLEEEFKSAQQISEIGMDSYWAPPEAKPEMQRKLFEAQLRMAVIHQKPVTLHTKGAENQVFNLLKQLNPPSILIHWFDGSREQLQDFLDLNCFFTIPPSIISNDRSTEMIKRIPLNRLLPETDNPPTWPWLFNHPSRAIQIKSVVSAASQILKLPASELHMKFKDNLRAFLIF
ncbi:hypothetical protein EXM22_12995 [Oceanispirochaeta crateris]|uniref:Uncharacterized protein n=1 Tax=Oceanispirochaeta crateris TaxID=2518645 RepID=A0A5C1QPD6_9SPIO|nr:TatD family hydrolase [Oceanispirochaeta crateris]QEN08860.1 hypothetical protein EXM22_12995 [Oceanispirochaeta crateris]